MKNIYNILIHLWKNYSVSIAMSILFQILIYIYKSEMDLIWFYVSYFIVSAPLVLIIIYGFLKYKKNGNANRA